MYQQARPVKFRTIFELIKLRPHLNVAGSIMVGISLLFLLISFLIKNVFVDSTIPTVDYDQINNGGTIVQGQITGIFIRTNVTDNGRHPAVISYRYTTDKGEFNSKYEIMSPEKVEAMKVGDNIEVKYLDNASILNGFEPYSFPAAIFAIVTLPFLVIGLLLLIPGIITIRKYLYLYRYGKVCNAELLSMTMLGGLNNFSRFGKKLTVEYAYKNSKGQEILGESITANLLLAQSKKIGDNVKIFVSPENESHSCLVPRNEVIRNNWTIAVS